MQKAKLFIALYCVKKVYNDFTVGRFILDDFLTLNLPSYWPLVFIFSRSFSSYEYHWSFLPYIKTSAFFLCRFRHFDTFYGSLSPFRRRRNPSQSWLWWYPFPFSNPKAARSFCSLFQFECTQCLYDWYSPSTRFLWVSLFVLCAPILATMKKQTDNAAMEYARLFEENMVLIDC